MIELRWLEYKVKVPPEFNALAPQPMAKKLQYRELYSEDKKAYWSNWKDVPTVGESK
jgi:hypothetical protein